MTARFRRTFALPVSAKAHIEKIQKDAGVSSETEAVVKALELGASCAERKPEEVQEALRIVDWMRRENMLSYSVGLRLPAGLHEGEERQVTIPLR
jgi:hypothetical protein